MTTDCACERILSIFSKMFCFLKKNFFILLSFFSMFLIFKTERKQKNTRY